MKVPYNAIQYALTNPWRVMEMFTTCNIKVQGNDVNLPSSLIVHDDRQLADPWLQSW